MIEPEIKDSQEAYDSFATERQSKMKGRGVSFKDMAYRNVSQSKKNYGQASLNYQENKQAYSLTNLPILNKNISTNDISV